MESEERLQRIIDAIPLGIHVTDTEGRIAEVNRVWLIQFGKTRDDVKGKPLKDVMRTMIFFDSGKSRKDDPWEFTDPAALEVLKTKLPCSSTFNQGRSVAIARPILDKQGGIACVVTTYLERQTKGTAHQSASRRNQWPELMLGRSEAMRQVQRMIRRVAATDATVMICGASGTGKEVVAGEIQRRSARADKPFVQVNCSAIPESLMEAELFGYEKGSFTGALKSGKIGLMESADGGTLLLDEVSEMPLTMQPKLLRAIQERTIVRVGSVTPVPVDIRILATSNRDLVKEVEAGRFREDLYYRLNVVPITLPPLKERGDDIRLLGEHFLEEYMRKYRRRIRLSEGAWEELSAYDWPGNVRQIRNHMERLVVLHEGEEITREQIRASLGLGSPKPAPAEKAGSPEAETIGNLQEATDQLQSRMIRAALRQYHTTYRAAEALGISQPTLIRKAKALGISTAREEKPGKPAPEGKKED